MTNSCSGPLTGDAYGFLRHLERTRTHLGLLEDILLAGTEEYIFLAVAAVFRFMNKRARDAEGETFFVSIEDHTCSTKGISQSSRG
jgi:hypothetical protein